MRHGKKINHLGRTASHRKAMLSNMATSLIQNKRIVTTVAKAKALKKYVEPIITKSKIDSTHSRRMVFRYLQDKESVDILFNEVSEKVADREGGYTRILKTGNRLGDNASMCVIELVDYNESMLKEAKPKRSRTRRSRRGKGSSSQPAAGTAAAAAAATTAEAKEEEETAVEQQETTEAAAASETEAAVEEQAESVEATEKEEVAPEEETADAKQEATEDDTAPQGKAEEASSEEEE